MIKSLALLAALFLPQLSHACPIGAGESELTLTRVMRNFGKGLFLADRATKKGELDPASVSEAELAAAMSGLDLAVDCAGLAANDRGGRLFPRKASELSGDVRERYLNLFFSRMKEFQEGLAGYRLIYAGISAAPVAERDFMQAKNKMREVGLLADRAHRDLE